MSAPVSLHGQVINFLSNEGPGKIGDISLGIKCSSSLLISNKSFREPVTSSEWEWLVWKQRPLLGSCGGAVWVAVVGPELRWSLTPGSSCRCQEPKGSILQRLLASGDCYFLLRSSYSSASELGGGFALQGRLGTAWRHFWLSQTGGLLLTSGGSRPRILKTILWYTGQPPGQSPSPQVNSVKVRNPVLKEWKYCSRRLLFTE